MKRLKKTSLLLGAVLLLTMAGTAQPSPQSGLEASAVTLEDFETYAAGGLPVQWVFLQGRSLVPVSPAVMTEQEQFFIVQEQGNKFVRARVTDQAHRIILTNGKAFDWNLQTMPVLQWNWRAIHLPEGAREDRRNKNDTGAALYVYFDRDWLGRPRTIKYTYSSTLPLGTEVSFGSLQVIVVSSGAGGTGKWRTVARDVAADYQRLFARTPPDRPAAIALWSDSDNTHQTAIADFDNLALRPGSIVGK